MFADRPIFEVYVDDDRYAVPTLHLVAARDEADALRNLQRMMQETPHHLGAELRLDGRLVAGVGSLASKPHTSLGAPYREMTA